jgi:uncharacterized membrane protein YbaN (DUF454 family)
MILKQGRGMSNLSCDEGVKAAPLDAWVIDLPAELRGNVARLHTTATNLLELAHVRSVIIGGDHSRAVVRLHASRSSAVDIGAIPSLDGAEPAVGAVAVAPRSTSVVSWTDPRDQSLCFIKLPERAQGLRRMLLLAGAAMSLVLGLLGILLPGLPTTPFVLVASYCLLRSSPRLHARLLESRLFGNVLRDWHLHQGIRPHVRYKATAVIALVLGASLYFAAIPLAAKIAILAVGIFGIFYVWRLPEVVE